MKFKRLTLMAGHYGSGKTNIAVNLAMMLKREGEDVVIADLDIVNPYYRTKDSEEELKAAGIPLISSEYANSNVDVPALPQELYSIVDVKSRYAIVDIGGDDRGALALGRYTPFILEENDYDMLLVINKYRPLTPDTASTLEVMREIEAAGGLPFTGIVNNSNLGRETTPEDVIASDAYAKDIAAATGLPIRMTTVKAEIAGAVAEVLSDVVPLHLQDKRLWND
jgi:CobQ/CobB/MinD/ParA nucleotide binding domain.